MKTLNVKEVSQLTGIGKSSIYRLARSKQIPCLRIGNRYIFTQASVEEWLSDQAENNGEFLD